MYAKELNQNISILGALVLSGNIQVKNSVSGDQTHIFCVLFCYLSCVHVHLLFRAFLVTTAL